MTITMSFNFTEDEMKVLQREVDEMNAWQKLSGDYGKYDKSDYNVHNAVYWAVMEGISRMADKQARA